MTDKREFELKDFHRNATVGTMRVEHLNIVENPNFVDYLRGGWGISLCVDIDFTASNIDPSNPQSLHYLN
jgi:hypothetical protein